MEGAANGAKQPTEAGKIFVGGLSWETTKESLGAHFRQFGEVAESVVMIESVTKKPRGFGFVTFEDACSVQKVMDYAKQSGSHHLVDNKQVDPKPAYVKGGPTDQGCGQKIFVGGISHETTDEDVSNYFSQYGVVRDVDLKMDKSTARKRGFAFVSFETEDAVDKVIGIHFHQLSGKTVECKKAQPRNQTVGKGNQHQTTTYGSAAPYGGYGQRAGDSQQPWYAYGQQPQHVYSQQPQQQQQQQPYHAGNYMNQGYPPQTAAAAYAPMGRGDMHNPPAPQAGVHQAHMTAGYGRGHDTGSYHGGATAAAVGYGQTPTVGAAAAYGGGQTGYNYETMPQVGGQGPHATASPYPPTAYSDTTANTGYPTVGGAAPPPQHKQQKANYGAGSYY